MLLRLVLDSRGHQNSNFDIHFHTTACRHFRLVKVCWWHGLYSGKVSDSATRRNIGKMEPSEQGLQHLLERSRDGI
ncbi:hypothetical protein pipiens_011579 [Culex pipiens pipiens]|uniref:Uncharacterized protein n=1 Tax=Culex pipiens pipiens TaxID=38569 RepID=A0ABD1CUK0_CULPP